MNVKAKFVGKVNHIVGGVTYEPNKEYTIDSVLAKHSFFEIKAKPKAEKPKAEKPKVEDK